MTWQRLEMTAVDPALVEGLAARVADPLWLMARQWQVGEFRGEDAARPVLIEIDVSSVAVEVARLPRAGGGELEVDRGESQVPLEALVEAEPVRTGAEQTALALEAGSAALRRMRQAGVPSAVITRLRDAYRPGAPPTPGHDPVGEARLRLLARTVIDGARLAADLDSAGSAAGLAALTGVTGTDLAAVDRALNAWRRDETALFTEPDPSVRTWRPRSLDYRFAMGAGSEGRQVELRADDYPGGHLDWYHFDVRSEVGTSPGGGKPSDRPDHRVLRVLPTPLRYAGQPAARFWEFEEGAVNHGALAAAPDDIARAVVAAFATVGGDDWFRVPCVLPVGSVAQVRSVRALDDFGTWTPVGATAALDGPGRVWRWFELGGDRGPEVGRAPLLFIAPVLADGQRGPVLERVDLRRDEIANIAWAIERRFQGPAGRSVERRPDGRPVRGEAPPPAPLSDTGLWRYRIATTVPPHWMPLVPVRISGDSPQVVLRRGGLAVSADAGWAHVPLGRILRESDPFLLNEEEIPDGGTRVVRRFQAARGADGRLHLWLGRRAGPGEGALGSTPLRFDEITRP